MQVCISLQTDNHASTQPLSFTCRMPFLPPDQQRQSTEGTKTIQVTKNLKYSFWDETLRSWTSKLQFPICARSLVTERVAIGINRGPILIQNELLEQVDTFPYLGSPITVDGECTTEFRTRLNRGQAIWASLQKIWKSHSIPISTKIRLMEALVWPAATHSCENWTLRKNEETRLDTFEMKGLTKILQVLWTTKKTK